ncbi:hypothetical protein K438DRAFT_1942794 [Mycena galopus ATCC 62051]|nr:hypothetical protein K438DRAFT_1942794 [Mycena galopus ATCC 62051]
MRRRGLEAVLVSASAAGAQGGGNSLRQEDDPMLSHRQPARGEESTSASSLRRGKVVAPRETTCAYCFYHQHFYRPACRRGQPAGEAVMEERREREQAEEDDGWGTVPGKKRGPGAGKPRVGRGEERVGRHAARKCAPCAVGMARLQGTLVLSWEDVRWMYGPPCGFASLVILGRPRRGTRSTAMASCHVHYPLMKVEMGRGGRVSGASLDLDASINGDLKLVWEAWQDGKDPVQRVHHDDMHPQDFTVAVQILEHCCHIMSPALQRKGESEDGTVWRCWDWVGKEADIRVVDHAH